MHSQEPVIILFLICLVTPPVHCHLERMPGTGLVAELGSRAQKAKKSLEENGLFAVHACLSCVLALWCWLAASSADVSCPASQQDNIKLIWHPNNARKSKTPECKAVYWRRGIGLMCIATIQLKFLRQAVKIFPFFSFFFYPPFKFSAVQIKNDGKSKSWFF